MTELPDDDPPLKRFGVYRCDSDGNPYECVAEYDTPAELRAHRWGLNYRYKIRIGGKFYSRKGAAKIIADGESV